MRRLGAGAVVLMVLLAGCEGALQGAGLGTESAAPGIEAPGVTSDGNVDAERLARAHVAALRGRSYTVEETVIARTQDGDFRGRRVVRMRVNGSRLDFAQRTEGDLPGPFGIKNEHRPLFEGSVPRNPDRPREGDVRAWSNGNRTYVALPGLNGTRRYVYDAPFALRDRFRGRGEILTYLGGVSSASISDTRRGGWPAYRIESAGTPSILAVVDGFGLVHALEATFEPGTGPGGGGLTYRLEYRRVGNTTVERPGWVDATVEWSDRETRVFEGTGQALLGPVESPGSIRIAFRGTTPGADYTVWVMSRDAGESVWFVDTTGPTDELVSETLPPGARYVMIETEGDWRLSVRPASPAE